MRKISRPGLVFPKYMDLILLSRCRFAEGRLKARLSRAELNSLFRFDFGAAVARRLKPF